MPRFTMQLSVPSEKMEDGQVLLSVNDFIADTTASNRTYSFRPPGKRKEFDYPGRSHITREAFLESPKDLGHLLIAFFDELDQFGITGVLTSHSDSGAIFAPNKGFKVDNGVLRSIFGPKFDSHDVILNSKDEVLAFLRDQSSATVTSITYDGVLEELLSSRPVASIYYDADAIDPADLAELAMLLSRIHQTAGGSRLRIQNGGEGTLRIKAEVPV